MTPDRDSLFLLATAPTFLADLAVLVWAVKLWITGRKSGTSLTYTQRGYVGGWMVAVLVVGYGVFAISAGLVALLIPAEA